MILNKFVRVRKIGRKKRWFNLNEIGLFFGFPGRCLLA